MWSLLLKSPSTPDAVEGANRKYLQQLLWSPSQLFPHLKLQLFTLVIHQNCEVQGTFTARKLLLSFIWWKVRIETEVFQQNITILLLTSDGLGKVPGCQSKCQEIRIFMSLINCRPVCPPIGCRTTTWLITEMWLAKTERYFVLDVRWLGSICPAITLISFCLDLSFDWNCPEKIATDQNMPLIAEIFKNWINGDIMSVKYYKLISWSNR